MIYIVFLDRSAIYKNKEAVGLYLDVIEAQDLAAQLSLKTSGAIYEVRWYYPGRLSGHQWSCDDLADDGNFSSSWRDGRCVTDSGR